MSECGFVSVDVLSLSGVPWRLDSVKRAGMRRDKNERGNR